MNQFHGLPDRFDPSLYSTSRDARLNYYTQHCFPEIGQIANRLHAVREDCPHLRRVFILTNGWGWWLNSLKDALWKDGWNDLISSLDLTLDEEQKHVAMGVDMAIAQQAEVFVGNGVSSCLCSFLTLLELTHASAVLKPFSQYYYAKISIGTECLEQSILIDPPYFYIVVIDNLLKRFSNHTQTLFRTVVLCSCFRYKTEHRAGVLEVCRTGSAITLYLFTSLSANHKIASTSSNSCKHVQAKLTQACLKLLPPSSSFLFFPSPLFLKKILLTCPCPVLLKLLLFYWWCASVVLMKHHQNELFRPHDYLCQLKDSDSFGNFVIGASESGHLYLFLVSSFLSCHAMISLSDLALCSRSVCYWKVLR